MNKLGDSLTIFCIFLTFSKLGNPFCWCCVNGLRRFTIRGFGEVVFAPMVSWMISWIQIYDLRVCRGRFASVETLNIIWICIVHPGCFFPIAFYVLGSQDVWPLLSNGVFLLGASLWWLGKVSPRNHLLIGWLCVWCMVWLGWVSPMTPPCYWLVFLNSLWNPTLCWLDYECMVLAMCEPVVP